MKLVSWKASPSWRAGSRAAAGARLPRMGSIIVPSTRPNSGPRPGKRKYAKPKAITELEIATKPAASAAIAMLLNIQCSNGN